MKLASKLLVAALAAAWPACRTAAGGDPAFTNETCSEACARLAAADCGDIGSSCVNSCLAHPNASYAASCAGELASYLDCFWMAESFDCAADARTVPVGCSTQLVAYEGSRSSADSGEAGGVGGAAGAAGSADVEPLSGPAPGDRAASPRMPGRCFGANEAKRPKVRAISLFRRLS